MEVLDNGEVTDVTAGQLALALTTPLRATPNSVGRRPARSCASLRRVDPRAGAAVPVQHADQGPAFKEDSGPAGQLTGPRPVNF